MSFEVDVLLVGTGLGPLMMAVQLYSRSKSVLILNPQREFFFENGEFPFSFNPDLHSSQAETAIDILRPYFPGAVEYVNPNTSAGATDREAPHLRARNWTVLEDYPDPERIQNHAEWLAKLKEVGIGASQLEGVVALKRFPGFSGKIQDSAQALWVPGVYDIDIERYRSGVRDFVVERFGDEQIRHGVSDLKWGNGVLQFVDADGRQQVKVNEAMGVFWSPQVWTERAGLGAPPATPLGQRLYEEWDLLSRDPIDPWVVGVYNNWILWGGFSGPTPTLNRRMTALRRGERLGLDAQVSFLTEGSFSKLEDLCHDLLGWERITVRKFRPRSILEWDRADWGLKVSDAQGVARMDFVGMEGGPLELARACNQALEVLP